VEFIAKLGSRDLDRRSGVLDLTCLGSLCSGARVDREEKEAKFPSFSAAVKLVTKKTEMINTQDKFKIILFILNLLLRL